MRRPELTVAQILRWIDEWKARLGRWPKRDNGRIPGSLGETWSAIEQALRKGHRGLPGKSSLARLLAERRGVRNRGCLPRFTIAGILAWADDHKRRKARWPTVRSGVIAAASGETWSAVHNALALGARGMPGGSSLARVLAKYRSVRNHYALPRFSKKRILRWADAFYCRHRRWPTRLSGAIPEAPGETWAHVQNALVQGDRGLKAGSSLARLLDEAGRARNRKALPPFQNKQIVAWAADHIRRTGIRPTHLSGPIHAEPRETWGGVHAALSQGRRGLPGGDSLYRLLLRHHLSVRDRRGLPPKRHVQRGGGLR